MTEDEMVGQHHRPDGLKFEQAPGMVMDREAWHAAVHGAAKSWTRLSELDGKNLITKMEIMENLSLVRHTSCEDFFFK